MGFDQGLSDRGPQRPGGFLPPVGDVPRQRLVLATWWTRAGALLLDTLIVMPVLLLGFALWTPELEGGSAVFESSEETLLLGALVTVVFSAYTTAALALWGGRTVGKKVVGIRVVREDGGAPGWATAAVRQVPLQAVVSSLVPFFALADYLWPVFDAQNRALHDLLARTRVVVDDPDR